MKKLLTTLAVAGVLSMTNLLAAEKEIDPQTGLVLGPGFEEVKNNCTVCHSAKFITLQRGDRDTWLQMIRWMQSTQGLWDFEPKLEDTILTYLAKHYPAGKASRRPNLKHTALPPNPYEN